VVIDPGDEADRILAEVRDGGLEVVSVLLTHGHADHVGGVRGIVESLAAEVLIHGDDASMLETAVEHGRMFGLEIERPPAPDRYLQDGDVIRFGSERVTVLHTPGHSPGAVSFLGDGVVFVGDTIFAGSVGRFDLPGGSYDALMRSISEKILTLDDSVTIYPGHGPATTVGAERRGNPFLTG